VLFRSDSALQPERLRAIELVLRARCSDRNGAAGICDLNCSRADAASDGVNEHRFARLQFRLHDERVVRGDECLRNCGGVGEGNIFRHARERALVDDDVLGIRAAARDSHHAIAHRKFLRVLSERIDLAGKFEPRNVARRAGRRRIKAHFLQ